MSTEEIAPIINRVESSGLVTLDLEDYLDNRELVEFDMAQFLEGGLILRERSFRETLRDFDWTAFQGKNVRIHCSSEALIPSWAYMLVTTRLSASAPLVGVGSEIDFERRRIDVAISRIDLLSLEDARVVIKGCGGISERDYAYVRLTEVLFPLVASLMYGEPCSTVPVYKRPKK